MFLAFYILYPLWILFFTLLEILLIPIFLLFGALKGKQYLLNVLIAYDQLINAVLNGNPDYTISARLAVLHEKQNGIKFYKSPLAYVIFKLLEKIDPGHCERALKSEQKD